MTDDTPWRDPETLRQLYVGEKLSTGQIGDRFGVTSQTVRKYLDRYGIERPRPWDDRDTLRELYHGKMLNQREIGELFDVSADAIRRAMQRHGVEVRDAGQRQKLDKWKGPAPFGTGDRGYERWKTTVEYDQLKVYVHRLLAVAEYGIDEIRGKEVHHKNRIKWDNRPDNIEVLDPSEHRRLHAEDDSWGVSP